MTAIMLLAFHSYESRAFFSLSCDSHGRGRSNGESSHLFTCQKWEEWQNESTERGRRATTILSREIVCDIRGNWNGCWKHLILSLCMGALCFSAFKNLNATLFHHFCDPLIFSIPAYWRLICLTWVHSYDKCEPENSLFFLEYNLYGSIINDFHIALHFQWRSAFQ